MTEWTQGDVEVLEELVEAHIPWKDIGARLERSSNAVYCKAINLKLITPGTPTWRPEPVDDEELRRRWLEILPELKENLRRDIADDV
jgi:hypothetical protein